MAIVIRNLVVIANITQGKEKLNGTPLQSQSESKAAISEDAKIQIIEEAVQQVMDILERQKDR